MCVMNTKCSVIDNCRGPIEKVDNIVPVTASSSLALSQDRKIVIWTIGKKYSIKDATLQTKLPGV